MSILNKQYIEVKSLEILEKVVNKGKKKVPLYVVDRIEREQDTYLVYVEGRVQELSTTRYQLLKEYLVERNKYNNVLKQKVGNINGFSILMCILLTFYWSLKLYAGEAVILSGLFVFMFSLGLVSISKLVIFLKIKNMRYKLSIYLHQEDIEGIICKVMP